MVRVRRADTLERALAIVAAIERAEENPVVNFEELSFLTPGAALVIASALRRRKFTSRTSEHASGFGYAGHIGFFDACGISDVGNAIGHAKGGPGYSPIRALSCEDIRRGAHDRGLEIAQALAGPAENLGRIIARRAFGPSFGTVTFAMREVMRNVIEHSGANEMWYAGQYWEDANMVEVAVLDEGVGLRTSLMRNPENGDVEDEATAIRLAMRAGVSEIPKDQRGQGNDNSGFGLYLVRRLCLRGNGAFSVVSNDAALEESAIAETSLPSAFVGTLLQLRLDVAGLDDFDALLAELVQDGESEQ